MGWLGNLLIVISVLRLADKHRDAFLWGAVGNVCWIIMSWLHGHLDLAALSVLLVILDTRAYIRWGHPNVSTVRL